MRRKITFNALKVNFLTAYSKMLNDNFTPNIKRSGVSQFFIIVKSRVTNIIRLTVFTGFYIGGNLPGFEPLSKGAKTIKTNQLITDYQILIMLFIPKYTL